MSLQLDTDEKQKQRLFDQITGELPYSGKGQILVFPMEAALGKTTTMVDAMLELYDQKPSVKSLIVTKLISEANELMRNINVGGKIAVAVHSKSRKKLTDAEIKNAPVVIITHKKYEDLCMTNGYKTNEDISLYTNGRTNLVIDEEMQLFETYTVTLDDYRLAKKVAKRLGSTYARTFVDLFGHLGQEFSRKAAPKFRIINEVKPESIQNLQIFGLMKSLDSIQTTHKMLTALDQSQVDYRAFRAIINRLVRILGSFSVIDSFGIHCCNETIDYLLLQNNILMDASASINKLYEHSSKMKIIKMKRVVDHHKWTLSFYDTNTSDSAKFNDDGHTYRTIARIVSSECTKEDKVLIIGSAQDVGTEKNKLGEIDKYMDMLPKGLTIKKVNYEAMRGRNTWGDYNKCFIIHTYTRPNYYYPLLLNYLKPNSGLQYYDLRMNTEAKNGRHTYYGFFNDDLDALRESDIFSSAYQAAKRINRDNDAKANIYVFTNRKKLKRILMHHMRNITIVECPFPKKTKYNRNGKYAKQSASSRREVELLDLLTDVLKGKYQQYEHPDKPGHYPKKWAAHMIAYKGTQFSKITNGIRPFIVQSGITEQKHYFVIKRKK